MSKNDIRPEDVPPVSEWPPPPVTDPEVHTTTLASDWSIGWWPSIASFITGFLVSLLLGRIL